MRKDQELRIMAKLDHLDQKMDDLRIDHEKFKTEVHTEAKTNIRMHGTIWGGITLVVSLISVAIAYFK